MSFLLWSCTPISMSPLPLVLHFPQLCCSWLLRCRYSLNTTRDYRSEKGKSWRKYSVRINDTSCLPCWKKKTPRNKDILPTRTLFLWQNIAACSIWELCFKNSFWESDHVTLALHWGQSILETFYHYHIIFNHLKNRQRQCSCIVSYHKPVQNFSLLNREPIFGLRLMKE